jgi:hypothetical protein
MLALTIGTLPSSEGVLARVWREERDFLLASTRDVAANLPGFWLHEPVPDELRRDPIGLSNCGRRARRARARAAASPAPRVAARAPPGPARPATRGRMSEFRYIDDGIERVIEMSDTEARVLARAFERADRNRYHWDNGDSVALVHWSTDAHAVAEDGTPVERATRRVVYDNGRCPDDPEEIVDDDDDWAADQPRGGRLRRAGARDDARPCRGRRRPAGGRARRPRHRRRRPRCAERRPAIDAEPEMPRTSATGSGTACP